jgi:hypothetical protein
MTGVCILGWLFVALGATGLTKKGLLLSVKKRLPGKPGRVIGGLSILFGIGWILLCLWAGSPEERSQMYWLSAGILGGQATWIVLRLY